MNANRLKYFIISLLVTLSFYACSSSEETTNSKSNEDDRVYVFDEIPDNSGVVTKKNTADEMKYNYIIQIGAFASKLNAEDFTAKSELILGEKLDVTFNEYVKLYVVRYRRVFNTRNEAEKIRNELWQSGEFRDAWIVEKPK